MPLELVPTSWRVGLETGKALVLSHEGDDPSDVVIVKSLDGWHITERPVVLRDASVDGQSKRSVTVVAGFIHD